MSIDAREMVADLREKAQQLLDAAAVIEKTYALSARPVQTASPAAQPQEVSADRSAPAERGSRVQQLTDFLRSRGPQTRKQILTAAGIPTGTVATLLSSDHFVRDKEGRWSPSTNGDGK